MHRPYLTVLESQSPRRALDTETIQVFRVKTKKDTERIGAAIDALRNIRANAFCPLLLRFSYCYGRVLFLVPGQAGGGSFKFETLIAYRA